MRSIPFIALLCVMMMVSCVHKLSNEEPGDVIPRKVMEKVMMDAAMAESYSQIAKDSLHRAGSKDLDSLAAYYRIIFNHYHITKEQFDKSLEWYKMNPDYMDSIYNNMIVKATRWQNNMGRK